MNKKIKIVFHIGDIHIRNIRKILGNESIRTSKGIGYSLNL